MRRWGWLCLFAMVLTSARAAPPVDLALVLAIDASGSASRNLLRFQIDGHAEAIVHPEVLAAIGLGQNRAVAVTVVQFSAPYDIVQSVPWRIVTGPEDALDLADEIRAMAPHRSPSATALVSTMNFAARMFEEGGFGDVRRVIDISSNGIDNVSGSPERTRDRLVARGITINALVIEDEIPDLHRYFSRRIVGGDEAFVVVVTDPADYTQALVRKLAAEIAGVPPPTRFAALR